MNNDNLSLKYRPKQFNDIVGQKSVKETLSRALDSKRVANAYLLSGLRGSGKTSTARILASCMVCDKGPTSKPCGICPNCEMRNNHIDIVEMDAASSRKIDDIRDIIEQTKYKPNIARYKIFIIDEVHMLTKEAFNSLLKTLEEPPNYIKFILATTDPLKVPATIISRTQHFRFKKISYSEINQHLLYILDNESIKYSEDGVKLISRSGNGSLRDTINILEQAIVYCNEKINNDDVSSMLGIINPIVIENIFNKINNQDRESLIKISKDISEYECENIINEMINFLKNRLDVLDPSFPIIHIERFFKILNESIYTLSLNANDEFVMKLTLLKLCEAVNSLDIDSVIRDIQKDIDTQPSIKTLPKTDDNNQDQFSKLTRLLYDRDTILGKYFSESIKFLSFSNNILSWQSSPLNAEVKKELIKNNHIIKYLVQEVYGINTKIESHPVKKDIRESNMVKDFKNEFE